MSRTAKICTAGIALGVSAGLALELLTSVGVLAYGLFWDPDVHSVRHARSVDEMSEDRKPKQPYEFIVPDGSDVVPCEGKSCKMNVIWIVTKAGKRMPLSASTCRDVDGTTVAISHFADCPDAGRFRRRR